MVELLARLWHSSGDRLRSNPSNFRWLLTLDYGTRTVYRLEPNGGKQVIPLTNKGVPEYS